MKLADLKPSPDGTIVVYAALNSTKYSFDANRENPEHCRWVVETGDDGRPIRYAKSSGWSHGARRDPRGTLVKLTRHYPDGRTGEQYATLAQIIGPYEETAAARRQIIERQGKANEAAKKQKQAAQDRRDQALDRLRTLGVEVPHQDPRFFAEVKLSIEAVETLLDQIERLRAQAIEDQATIDLHIGQAHAEGE